MTRVVVPLLVAVVVAVVALSWLLPGDSPDLEQRCESRGGQLVSYGPTGEDCVVDGRFVRL